MRSPSSRPDERPRATEVRVALCLGPDDERRLAASAEHHGHTAVAGCSGGDELAIRLAQQQIDLVIVVAAPTLLTAALVESADLLGVRMLVVVGNAEERQHARRLGIVDVVDGPPAWTLLDPAAPRPAQALEHTARPPHPAAVRRDADGAAEPGKVIAVWGPHGAPGRTSVAIALAAELAASGLRVVLADADTHAASVAPTLGLLDEAPGFAAACRLAGIGGLDDAQFDRIAAPFGPAGGGFRVLTGLGRPSRWPELGEERVTGALASARVSFQMVVVDVAASLERDSLDDDATTTHRNAAGLAALRCADRVVALAAADAVGIGRFLRGHAELGDLVERERVVVAVNKVRARVLGPGPGGQVRQTLERFGGIREAVLIPWDPAAFDAALLAGRPLRDAAPRSAARAAIRELADRLVPGAIGQSGRRRRGRRIA